MDEDRDFLEEDEDSGLSGKLNIILIILLVVILGVAGFFGVKMLLDNRSVTVPDFLGKNKEVAVEWCGSLKEGQSCKFEYEYTTNIEEDTIYAQSISACNDMTDSITITVSKGIKEPDIVAPVITENTAVVDIQAWALENGISNIEYVEENSANVGKDMVIRIEPVAGITKNTKVTIYVSKGPSESETSDGNIEIKAGTYVNMTVSEFETKAKSLGLVPNHNTSRDDTSSTVTKGNIVWHGSGTYEKGETINYGICTCNECLACII